MRTTADKEALLIGQPDVPSDQFIQPVMSMDPDGGKPILLGENLSDELFDDPFGRENIVATHLHCPPPQT